MSNSAKLIVIVDDDEAIRTMLKRRLLREGYRVATAADAERALALVAEQEVAVVLTDVRMPGRGGVDLLRSVRRERPETEVVLMSGNASLDSAVEAVRLGAFDYVEKPFVKLDRVVECIRRALERHSVRVNEQKRIGQLTQLNEGLRRTAVRRTKELEERTETLRLLVEQAREAALRHRLAREKLNAVVVRCVDALREVETALAAERHPLIETVRSIRVQLEAADVPEAARRHRGGARFG